MKPVVLSFVQHSWESAGFTCVLCVCIVLVCDRSPVPEVVNRRVGGSSGGLVMAKQSCAVGWNGADGIAKLVM